MKRCHAHRALTMTRGITGSARRYICPGKGHASTIARNATQ